ncbi:hypothetical protein GCM10009839_33290 [Catenulispora yoronensis]|uniref:Uncharacterized protein n=1 Tax=Catenulispora yoronensis TaxID=450799 RepID=A0ABP5FNM0_9ACTN
MAWATRSPQSGELLDAAGGVGLGVPVRPASFGGDAFWAVASFPSDDMAPDGAEVDVGVALTSDEVVRVDEAEG